VQRQASIKSDNDQIDPVAKAVWEQYKQETYGTKPDLLQQLTMRLQKH
jgi:hypothetical protein